MKKSLFIPSHLTPHHSSFLLVFIVVRVSLCCLSARSAAPDLHKLNEDGELWLVNQGLKETIRFQTLRAFRACWSVHGRGWGSAAFLLHFLPFWLFSQAAVCVWFDTTLVGIQWHPFSVALLYFDSINITNIFDLIYIFFFIFCLVFFLSPCVTNP